MPMSISIALDQLRTESARFGSTPYLLTQGEDGRPHAVAVSCEWQADGIRVRTGRRSLGNVGARPLVSLLWPPFEVGGYSLIIDGHGSVDGEGDAARAIVRPTRGVLHRPGTASVAQARGCGSDCVPLFEEGPLNG